MLTSVLYTLNCLIQTYCFFFYSEKKIKRKNYCYLTSISTIFLPMRPVKSNPSKTIK
jgi:hypothetical protein